MNPSRVPAGSWTPQAARLSALPAALETLLAALDRQRQKQAIDPGRLEALTALSARLAALRGQFPGPAQFEEALSACHAYGHDRTESYLAFIYAVMRQPLTDYTSSYLRRLRSREDVDVLAIDLVGTLFAELAEALMDDDDPGASSRLPPVGRTIPWLYQAIRHDALDHCKSGSNRREQCVDPAPDEGYDQALERMAFAPLPGQPDAGVSELDAAERRQAFVEAFDEATAGLKPRHQEVLRLREVESLSVEEIAARLELTRRKVLDLLQYAREKRAQLLVSRLRSRPALANLQGRAGEVTMLLQRVRLWGLARGLRPGPRRAEEAKWPATPEAAWLPLDAPRSERGAAHARGRRKL
jgi:RNA polymerase sigma factor (sigma-70 family)